MTSYDVNRSVGINPGVKLVFAAVLMFLTIVGAFQLFEQVDADEIVVIQAPFSGELNWYTSAGVKMQNFGKITRYQKLVTVDFKSEIMFNDNGTGIIPGTYQVELPMDVTHLTDLHTKYGSQEAIERSLVKATLDKVVNMTGPMMSSKEASAEMKTDLIRYIIDQLENGVYQTRKRSEKRIDVMTNQETVQTIAEVELDKSGRPMRQEGAILTRFGIVVSNFAPRGVEFDDRVKAQIAKQQEITMRVQTAIAEKLEAEQRRITAQADGEANVTKAKYEMEVEKQKAVTDAEKVRDVARLSKESAEFTKQANILKGEGEATYKRLVMQADGALAQKLEAYKAVNAAYAEAMAKYPGAWVPQTVMGGTGVPMNGAQALMELFTAKTARDLALDMKMQGQK